MSTPKLSGPQLKLLIEFSTGERKTCWHNYPPVIKLLSYGFVAEHVTGIGYSTAYRVTAAGRSYLESHKGEEAP